MESDEKNQIGRMLFHLPLPITAVALSIASLGNLLEAYSESVRLFCGALPDSGAVRAAEISGRVFLRLAACPLAALNVTFGNTTAIFLSVGVCGVLAVVVRRSDRFGNK